MKTLLLVDDSASDRANLIAAAEDAGLDYEIIAVTDGDAGIAAIDREAPDIVLLDLNMPSMGGIEVLRALQSRGITESLAVVVYSSSRSEDDRKKSRRYGAVGYLAKPARYLDLVARLRDMAAGASAVWV